MNVIDTAALSSEIIDAVGRAPDGPAAMRGRGRAPQGAAAALHVGRHLPPGRRRARAGTVPGQAVAAHRIPLNRGICGAAATQKTTIVVDDVNADPRYLACSLETRSEIVVPILRGEEVLGEIDIDSDRPAAFGAEDRQLLEAVAAALAARL